MEFKVEDLHQLKYPGRNVIRLVKKSEQHSESDIAQGIYHDPRRWHALINEIASNPFAVMTLDLSYVNMYQLPDECFNLACQLIETCFAIVNLKLDHTHLGEAFNDEKNGISKAERLGSAIQHCLLLKYLFLNNNELGSSPLDPITALSQHMLAARNLTHLDLSQNKFGSYPGGGHNIFQLLQDCQQVSSLRLSDPTLHLIRVTIWGACCDRFSRLQSLDLSYVNLFPTGQDIAQQKGLPNDFKAAFLFNEICKGEQASKMQRLNLSHTNIEQFLSQAQDAELFFEKINNMKELVFLVVGDLDTKALPEESNEILLGTIKKLQSSSDLKLGSVKKKDYRQTYEQDDRNLANSWLCGNTVKYYELMLELTNLETGEEALMLNKFISFYQYQQEQQNTPLISAYLELLVYFPESHFLRFSTNPKLCIELGKALQSQEGKSLLAQKQTTFNTSGFMLLGENEIKTCQQFPFNLLRQALREANRKNRKALFQNTSIDQSHSHEYRYGMQAALEQALTIAQAASSRKFKAQSGLSNFTENVELIAEFAHVGLHHSKSVADKVGKTAIDLIPPISSLIHSAAEHYSEDKLHHEARNLHSLFGSTRELSKKIIKPLTTRISIYLALMLEQHEEKMINKLEHWTIEKSLGYRDGCYVHQQLITGRYKKDSGKEIIDHMIQDIFNTFYPEIISKYYMGISSN